MPSALSLKLSSTSALGSQTPRSPFGVSAGLGVGSVNFFPAFFLARRLPRSASSLASPIQGGDACRGGVWQVPWGSLHPPSVSQAGTASFNFSSPKQRGPRALARRSSFCSYLYMYRGDAGTPIKGSLRPPNPEHWFPRRRRPREIRGLFIADINTATRFALATAPPRLV